MFLNNLQRVSRLATRFVFQKPYSVVASTARTGVTSLQEWAVINHKIELPQVNSDLSYQMDSVLRKRRLKMKKHKLRKRRREQRALKQKLKR